MSRSPLSQPTILVVDDERECRSAVRRCLHGEGYRIVEVPSAHQALAFLGANEAEVMITDHAMPFMDGLELLRRARQLRPQMTHVMLTGHADVETARTILNEGLVERFLTKPWDPRELRATLREAIDFPRRRSQYSNVNASR
jgi:DNA-binding NtrC family response regulator